MYQFYLSRFRFLGWMIKKSFSQIFFDNRKISHSQIDESERFTVLSNMKMFSLLLDRSSGDPGDDAPLENQDHDDNRNGHNHRSSRNLSPGNGMLSLE